VERVNEQNEEFEMKQDLDTKGVEIVNNTNDKSRKNYFREFKKVVKSSDVILEVLDARDPLGTRSENIEKQILALDPNKKIILVLNKIDLIPKDNVQQWLKYLRNFLPTIAFKASTQKQKKNIGISKVQSDMVKGSLLSTSNECFGAEGLVFLLKNYSRSFEMKKTILVGIIGFPNVGKSSIINSLKRSKSVAVGAMPGLTKMMQEVHLDSNIKLLDCPGIIFDPGLISEADAALRNCIKVEQIEDPILPVEAIVKRCNKEKLSKLYNIGEFEDTISFLNLVAQVRGKILQGGVSDLNGTAKLVIKDWNKGKIPYYTLPPEENNFMLETTVVQDWGKEFDLNSIMDIESKVLEEHIEEEKLYTQIPSQTINIVDDNMLLSIDDDNQENSNMVIGEIRTKKERRGFA